MNFLCLASLFMLFQLSLGWTANYICKLAGFVLFLAGLGELEQLCRIQRRGSEKLSIPQRNIGRSLEKLMIAACADPSERNEDIPDYGSVRISVLEYMKGRTKLCVLLCACAAGLSLALDLAKPPAWISNVVSCIMGTAVSLASLALLDLAVRFIVTNERNAVSSVRFVNNKSEVYRLRAALNRASLCTVVNLVCDIVNRLVPISGVQSFFGFFAAISKITLYVFAVMTVYSFNKVRSDSNKKYDSENKNGG